MKKKEELKTRLRSYGHQYYKMIGNFTGEEREKWLDRNDEEIIVWIEEEVRQAEEKAWTLYGAICNCLVDEIDHTVDCATNASEVADEFRAMGCTCGRDKFVKQFKGKL